MDDARQWFGESCPGGLEIRRNSDGVHCGDGQVLGESAGRAGDSVLGIRIALVRVPRRTVLAKRSSAATQAIETLIDGDAVAEAEVAHRCAQFDHLAGDLVAEDLRLAGERNGLTALVCVVVGLTAVDMEVGAA